MDSTKKQELTSEKVLNSSLESIATVGSPSTTTEIALEIMGTAAQRRLVGEMIMFKFIQDNKPHYSLGQITEVKLRNIWLEEPTIKSLARQRGSVNPVSGQQDTHQGTMMASAVFEDNGDSFGDSFLGTVPPTGTPVYVASDSVFETLLSKHKKDLFYLGNFYESDTKLPLWFRHFGDMPNGAGEAYHIGIFGMTGSGKSTLAKMLLLAYARHKEMAIFVIDPAGQFAKSAKGVKSNEGFQLDLKNILPTMNKPLIVTSVRDLLLDRWELFGEILYESLFFQILSIPKGDHRRNACDLLEERLKDSIKLKDLALRESFEQAWQILGDPNIQQAIYVSTASLRRLSETYTRIDTDPDGEKEELFNRYWSPVARLFGQREGALSVNQLIFKVFDKSNSQRPVVIVDLSKESLTEVTDDQEKKADPDNFEEQEDTQTLWNDTIQALVIKRLLDALSLWGKKAYDKGELLNTLVVLDEAQKLARREKYEDDEKREAVRNELLNVVQTTRKYGLGWMFISLSLSSLHREIYNQLTIAFYGYGLSSGMELNTLKELVSDEHSIKLYQSFRHPHSSFDQKTREYSFMTRGPVSPLSFIGSPLFLTAFNNPEAFLKINGLVSKPPDPKQS